MDTQEQIEHLIETLQATRGLEEKIKAVIVDLCDRLKGGHTVFTAGNGGSAADALHLAQELTGRYSKDRQPLPGICLNADPTAMTCIANEYGFESIFARQMAAFGKRGDVFFAFTTSGNSENVIRAVKVAREKGVISILLGGKDGGQLKGRCEHELIVPSQSVSRIQEVHSFLIHVFLEAVDAAFE